MLPITLLDSLPANNINLLNLVFEEITRDGNSEENLESATDCII